jgi:excinuclease UvrABC helicase subunit UvrB
VIDRLQIHIVVHLELVAALLLNQLVNRRTEGTQFLCFPTVFVCQCEVIDLVGFQKSENHLEICTADRDMHERLLAFAPLDVKVKRPRHSFVVIDCEHHCSQVARSDSDHQRC